MKMKTIEWKLIETAPYNVVVLLTGDSGVGAPYNKYIISGYRDYEFHQGAWNDIQGDTITDQFSNPKYWAKMIFLP